MNKKTVNTIPGNSIPDNSIPGNSIPDNTITGILRMGILRMSTFNSRFIRSTLPVLLLIAALLGVEAAPAFGQDATSDAADKRIFLPYVRDTRNRANCVRRAPEHIFGVQMYGNTGPGSTTYDALLDSKAAWVRVALDWIHVEPSNTTPNRYNWRHADSVVGAANYACLETILTFGTVPGWVSSVYNGPMSESKFPEVAEFLAAVAERYDGDGFRDAPGKPIVNYIEIYNEPDGRPLPNAGSFSTWGTNGALYAKLLATIYPAIKKANPNMQVLIGGLAYDQFSEFVETFLDDVVANGGGSYFDIMNFHAYPLFGPDWAGEFNGPGLLEKTNHLRKKLADLGVPNKPIMITESGWHNNPHPDLPSNDKTHMRLIVQLLTQAKAVDAKALIYFSFVDPSQGADAIKNGLLTADNPPVRKPGFKTYQMVVELLGPARFDKVLSRDETRSDDMQVYQFTDTARNTKIYVAWLDLLRNPTFTVDLTQTAVLRLPGKTAIVHTTADERSTVRDGDDSDTDGIVRVQVGIQPLIIEVTQ